jgi:hypothetical protein
MISPYAQADTLSKTITDEIFYALGLSRSGIARRILGPVFKLPADRFAHLGADFDRSVAEQGFCQATRDFLPHFVNNFQVYGQENIPAHGPLLITMNHPGTYDGFFVTANLPREDFKVIISGVPFVKSLPAISKYLIYTSYDVQERIKTVRTAIQHLKAGGALIIMPRGNVDPDPAFMPGAHEALDLWSPSLALFLRQVPETNLQVTIVSGVLDPRFLRNPIVKIRKRMVERQKLAEIIQIITQLFSSRQISVNPAVSFAPLLTPAILQNAMNNEQLLRTIVQHARQSLDDHITRFSLQSFAE